MKTTKLSIAIALILSAAMASGAAFAAKPPDAGGGRGGSGGGGGGGDGGGGSGGGGGGGWTNPDLGDLIVLYRDASGVPILTNDTDKCQQPLAAPGIDLPAISPFAACTASEQPNNSCVIPVDPATCSVVVGYETYTQEVDFGRTSVVRAPVSVLQQQLDDVIVNLATADCVTLDPAGRLVTSTVTDNVVTSGAIDSPLQNLAIYRQLITTGYLGTQPTPLDLKDPNFLNTAARGIGAASDKTGKVSVDMVAYLNQIMGLTDPATATVLPKICINVREEVKGVVQTVQKCFLNYGAAPAPINGPYNYERTVNFTSLPTPPYIPASGPLPGWFEYLGVTNPDPTAPTFYKAQGPILDAPELFADKTLTGSNIGGFAQASDDARAVINFMHSWPLPVLYATPLSCTASGNIHYDVSISPDSGLQVPVRIVDGSEGREFTVAVANAGPDAASGAVTVTAIADGNPIATFPRVFTFTDLAAGSSKSWTELFTISLGHATTITWTATAAAEHDVNLGNNSVTETSQVKVTGGGGGGGGRGR
ncbi:MAG: hypothetical protein PHY54_08935 [Methylococcales bacterium]|nr:hypothetical protein [Methylococcales bacterium]